MASTAHTTHEIRQSLLSHDSEYQRLSERHSQCESQLEQISHSPYLNSEDLIQEADLKKIKLRLKDEMERIMWRYQHAVVQH
jgi:uncharacterized protein YdcH (DUF465 family)